MKPIACKNCGRTICKGNITAGVIEIKCSKCGQINSITPVKWQTINTSTSKNVLDLQYGKSKDWDKIINNK